MRAFRSITSGSTHPGISPGISCRAAYTRWVTFDIAPKARSHASASSRSTESSSASSGSPTGTRRETPTASHPGSVAKWRTAAYPTNPDAPAISTRFVAMPEPPAPRLRRAAHRIPSPRGAVAMPLPQAHTGLLSVGGSP